MAESSHSELRALPEAGVGAGAEVARPTAADEMRKFLFWLKVAVAAMLLCVALSAAVLERMIHVNGQLADNGAALRELADGTDELGAGLDRLLEGQKKLEAGQRELLRGQREILFLVREWAERESAVPAPPGR